MKKCLLYCLKCHNDLVAFALSVDKNRKLLELCILIANIERNLACPLLRTLKESAHRT